MSDPSPPSDPDLREFGTIEQDADLVALIHRLEPQDKLREGKSVAELIIAKHRHGITDTIELEFLGETMTFQARTHAATAIGRRPMTKTCAILTALLTAACAATKPAPVTVNTSNVRTSSQEAPAGYRRVKGSFDIEMAPQAPYETNDGIMLGRATSKKAFHGPLDATSTGEMLSALTGVKGSAGYVAIERVVGKLEGRAGSFILQHSGTMTRGAPELVVTVVPDSSTGELAGLTGRMAIDISEGKHFYTFDYRLGGK